MDDFYGDPRNYDPNYDPANPVYGTWGDVPDQAPPPIAPTRQATAVDNRGPGGTPTANTFPMPTDAPPGYHYEHDYTGVGWQLVGDNGSTYIGPGGNSGGGGSGGGNGFDYGRPDTLNFSPYREMNPFVFSQGAFKYDPYTASSRDDLYNDQKNPGFVRSQERLRKMIEAGAAYKGVLRSGNTFNELGSILGNNEEQQFKAFDDRRFRDWSGNRENAADAWSRNLGAEQWSYGQQANENQNFNNYRFNTEKSNFDDLLSRWQTLVNSATSLARPVA